MLTLSTGALALLLTGSAYAEFHCSVDVKKVRILGNGRVTVMHSGRNQFTLICNLNGDWKGVGVSTCAMWTSMLQNIKKNDGRAVFSYKGTGTCSSLPVYAASPVPTFIEDT